MSFGSSDLQFSFNFQKSNYYYVCPWCLWVNAHTMDICRGKRATLWSCFTYFGFMWSQRSNSDFQPYSQVSLPTEQCCQPWLTIFFLQWCENNNHYKMKVEFWFLFSPCLVIWYFLWILDNTDPETPVSHMNTRIDILWTTMRKLLNCDVLRLITFHEFWHNMGLKDPISA